MIALAVTRAPVAPRWGETTRRWRAGAWWLTAMVAGALAEIEDARDGIVVRERVRSASGSGAELLRAVAAPARGTIEVTRPGIGARAFFHGRTPDGGFAGATHVSALRALGVPIAEDPAALPELFAYGHVTPPATVFRSLSEVPLTGSLRVRATDAGIAVAVSDGADWLAGTEHTPLGLDEAVEAVAAQLSATVGRLASGAEQVTTLLSGGLDSSILARIAAGHPGGRRSMSTGFPFEDAEHNGERDYAVSAAECLGTDHRYREPSLEQYLDGVLQATLVHEQPVYGLQTVLLWWLFAGEPPPGPAAAVLCGEGADGTFGGPMHAAIDAGRAPDPVTGLLARTPGLDALLRAVGRRWWRAERLREALEPVRDRARSLDDPAHLLWEYGREGDLPWIARHFGVARPVMVRSAIAAIRPFAHLRVDDLVMLRSHLGKQHALESMWSKMAEAGGWAMVYPFTDETLLRTTMRIPWAARLASPKHVLRLVALRLGVPELVVARPKLSFSVDTRRWAMPGGPLEPLARLAGAVVPPETLRELQRPDYRIGQLYWRALTYAIWTRLVIREEPLARLQAELAEAVDRTRAARA